jgi:hypothetical protein
VLVLLTILIYVAGMMFIYREDAGTMVHTYWDDFNDKMTMLDTDWVAFVDEVCYGTLYWMYWQGVSRRMVSEQRVVCTRPRLGLPCSSWMRCVAQRERRSSRGREREWVCDDDPTRDQIKAHTRVSAGARES